MGDNLAETYEFDEFDGFTEEDLNKTNNKDISMMAKRIAKSMEVSLPRITKAEFNSLISTGLKNIKEIEKDLNKQFFEREQIIKVLLIALVSSRNIILIGQPGTGKTAIIHALAKKIKDSSYFEILTNETTLPDEFYGPFSLNYLKDDISLRIPTGYIPTANLVYVDEIGKCNSKVLNLLLPIINEKKFYNVGIDIDVPLVLFAGASNEGLENDELAALVDRLHLKMYVEDIGDISNLKNMMLLELNPASLKSDSSITLKEVVALQKACTMVKFPENVLDTFIKICVILREKGLFISSRRMNKCLSIIQATALLNNRNIVHVSDLKYVVYSLYSDMDNLELVKEEVDKYTDPYTVYYSDYSIQIDEMKRKYDKAEDVDKHNTLTEIKLASKKLIANIKELIIRMDNDNIDTSQMSSLIKRIETYIKTVDAEFFNYDIKKR